MSSNTVLPEHAYYCFDVIHAQLSNSTPSPPIFDTTKEYPLFVTWNVLKRGEMRLRGCIGNFEASPIGKGLKDYALISAFKDTRFDPVTLDELNRLECGVSLLTDFELCDEPYDWDLGTHGIYIQFPSMPTTPSESSSLPSKSTIKISYNSLSSLPPYILPPQTNGTRTRTLSATFLPDVPPEQGWTKLETLNSAISKAGYKGMIDEKVRKSCRVIRYQSRKILVGHEEWNSSREG